MAYNSLLTAALSGATLAQLAHWRKPHPRSGAVLVPEVSDTRPILYSFRDIIALRTCVLLRRDKPLQQVRRALANLTDLGHREHLSEYTLASDGVSIVLVQPDEPPVDLLKRPGQGVGRTAGRHPGALREQRWCPGPGLVPAPPVRRG